ncbi:MAG: hypothetical protein Q7T91_08480 [Sulfuricurvum sp.]|nr:hypothetical protein [Sulfuricurvum sp.]
MNIHFEPLTPEPRNREYELYASEQRAKIVYGYLFEGLSHREHDIHDSLMIPIGINLIGSL